MAVDVSPTFLKHSHAETSGFGFLFVRNTEKVEVANNLMYVTADFNLS
jgi:hypothetical protein